MSNQHTDDSFMYTTDIPLDYFRGEYDEDNDDTPLDILGRPIHEYTRYVISHDLPSRAFVDSLLDEISSIGQYQEELEKEDDDDEDDDEDFGNTINDIMPNYSLMCESLTHEELSSLLKANLLAEIKKYNLKDMSTFDHLENAQIYLDQLNFIQMQEFTHNGNV